MAKQKQRKDNPLDQVIGVPLTKDLLEKIEQSAGDRPKGQRARKLIEKGLEFEKLESGASPKELDLPINIQQVGRIGEGTLWFFETVSDTAKPSEVGEPAHYVLDAESGQYGVTGTDANLTKNPSIDLREFLVEIIGVPEERIEELLLESK